MKSDLNPSDFLTSGEQTKVDINIQEIADKIADMGIDFVFSVLRIIHKSLKPDYSLESKRNLLRTRTASEILKSGFSTGCTDYALLAIAIFRAKNIPAAYVETFSRRWLESDDEYIHGHIFVEIFIDNRWFIVDAEDASIKDWYNRSVVCKKGLDSWDLGIKNILDLKKAAFEFRDEYKKSRF